MTSRLRVLSCPLSPPEEQEEGRSEQTTGLSSKINFPLNGDTALGILSSGLWHLQRGPEEEPEVTARGFFRA